MSDPVTTARDIVLTAITGSSAEWEDQTEVARTAVDELLAMLADGEDVVGDAARELVRCRPDSAMLLGVGLAGTEHRPATSLRRVQHMLTMPGIGAVTAERIAGVRHLGVSSIGTTTRGVLEHLEPIDGVVPHLIVPSTAVARGLGYLRFTMSIGDPATAGAVLVPTVAHHTNRVWTTEALADLALKAKVRGARVVPVTHPAANLSDAARALYRPGDGIVDTVI